MRNKILLILTGFFIVIIFTGQSMGQEFAPLEMGVNVNERPHWLQKDMLQQSQTTWTRAFIEASHYIKAERSLDDDYRIEALKRVADNGYKVLLSIKWDIREAGWRVPEPGSEEEQQWFRFAEDLIKELEGDISILVLVNENTIDTPQKDLKPNDEEIIPFVRFQKRLLEHVHRLNPKSAEGKDLPLYTGGFTRLDQKKQQNHPANKATIEWVNGEDRLAGIDYHMHQPDYKTSIEASEFIRSQVPDKSLIVTEFSLVWKWKAHMQDKVGASKSGEEFTEKYDVDPSVTVAEYSTQAFQKPVSETEWNDFLNSRRWFEPYYLDIMGRIMEKIDVDVATYAFTQIPDSHESWKVTKRTDPWFVNQLFIPHLKSANEEKVSSNHEFLESFRRWQQTTEKLRLSQ